MKTDATIKTEEPTKLLESIPTRHRIIELLIAHQWIRQMSTSKSDRIVGQARYTSLEQKRKYYNNLGFIPAEEGYYRRHANGYLRTTEDDGEGTFISFAPYKLTIHPDPVGVNLVEKVTQLAAVREGRKIGVLTLRDEKPIEVAVRYTESIVPPAYCILLNESVECVLQEGRRVIVSIEPGAQVAGRRQNESHVTSNTGWKSDAINATCQSCRKSFSAEPRRTFFGFQKLECPSCKVEVEYPLTRGSRTNYWLMLGFFAAIVSIVVFTGIRFPFGGLVFWGSVLLTVLFQDWTIGRKVRAAEATDASVTPSQQHNQ